MSCCNHVAFDWFVHKMLHEPLFHSLQKVVRLPKHRIAPLMYWMYFVVVTLLFQLLAKHSSAALPCKQFFKHL